jgi:hypothetical protein
MVPAFSWPNHTGCPQAFSESGEVLVDTQPWRTNCSWHHVSGLCSKKGRGTTQVPVELCSGRNWAWCGLILMSVIFSWTSRPTKPRISGRNSSAVMTQPGYCLKCPSGQGLWRIFSISPDNSKFLYLNFWMQIDTICFPLLGDGEELGNIFWEEILTPASCLYWHQHSPIKCPDLRCLIDWNTWVLENLISSVEYHLLSSIKILAQPVKEMSCPDWLEF